MSLAVSQDSSGQDPGENTEQFQWVVTIQQNLEWLFADDPTVFIVGNLFWYPLQDVDLKGSDVMVVFGRLKGERGVYKQWSKDDILPQVVFEILSPHHALLEMERKRRFYGRYGAEEYYTYQPNRAELKGWVSRNGTLEEIEPMANWVSPAIGIRFDLSGPTLQLYGPDGSPFRSYEEISQQAEQAQAQAEQLAIARQDVVPRLLGMGLSVEQVAEALELSVEAVQAATHGELQIEA